MVKKGAAKVIKRFPFTIQLDFKCENKVQDVFLGIDTGYGNIGFSAVSEKLELICGTLKLDGRTTHPTPAVEGMIYYNTTTDLLMIYTTGWHSINIT